MPTPPPWWMMYYNWELFAAEEELLQLAVEHDWPDDYLDIERRCFEWRAW